MGCGFISVGFKVVWCVYETLKVPILFFGRVVRHAPWIKHQHDSWCQKDDTKQQRQNPPAPNELCIFWVKWALCKWKGKKSKISHFVTIFVGKLFINEIFAEIENIMKLHTLWKPFMSYSYHAVVFLSCFFFFFYFFARPSEVNWMSRYIFFDLVTLNLNRWLWPMNLT